MDICDGIIVADSPDSMHYTLPGSYTIRWVYSDSTGNSTTQLQTVIVEKILSDCPEDLNQDTLIDIQDYLMIVGDFGKVCTCCPGDLDQNQSIEVNDYLMVVGKFGQVCN
jgi:hypothetical protein